MWSGNPEFQLTVHKLKELLHIVLEEKQIFDYTGIRLINIILFHKNQPERNYLEHFYNTLD